MQSSFNAAAEKWIDANAMDYQIASSSSSSSDAPGVLEVLAVAAVVATAAVAESVNGAGEVEDVGRPTTIRTVVSCWRRIIATCCDDIP